MGLAVSNLLSYFIGKEDVRIVMVGLDGAGKTTILYRLKMGEQIMTLPTIGFNVETVEYKNLRFTVWDVGGQKRIRELWYHYYKNTSAVIFVVDSTDGIRFETAAEELQVMLDHDELRDAVVLILANKQDLPQAASVTEIAKALELNKFKQQWHIQATCATNGNGLTEGLESLRDMLIKRKKLSRA